MNAKPARRRTKIIATLGPATRAPGALRTLLEAGVDVVRLNLAHDDPRAHQRTAAAARDAAKDLDRVVGVLVDLPGPKMRTGPIVDGAVLLEAEGDFTLTEEELEGDAARVCTSVEGLSGMVSSGDVIYLADGAIVLEVRDTGSSDVHTSVVRGGVLRSRKGMHIPRAERVVQTFSATDRDALKVGLGLRADLVGLSFVRDALDVRRVREALPKRGHVPHLVAKIETSSAVENLEEIIAEADAVMVARGDLGIQTPLRSVPLLQKEIIDACNKAGKPVITATQMLESMTRAPLPTRAEVADVANAVLDGTDALMLSEETAVGEYARETVATMADIALSAEARPCGTERPSPRERSDDRVSWAVARAAVEAAEDVAVRAILCPTRSGATPRRVAAFRPSMPIIGLSGSRATIGALALVWGVIPLPMPAMKEARDAREEVERTTRASREAGLVDAGDLVAVAAGSPGPRAGRTDYVRIARC
ncbi:MAG: pyruvate kinase [Actinomycetota bacterium]